MTNEVVPSVSAGPWKLGMQKREVIDLLNNMSIEYTEQTPGGFDFVYSNLFSFNFKDDQSLKQICVVGSGNETNFQGVSIGDQVSKLGEKGHIVSADYLEGLLILRDTPGIFFNFEDDDEYYLGTEEIELEGDDEELFEAINPPFIMQSNIDRICVTFPFESTSIIDLNA